MEYIYEWMGRIQLAIFLLAALLLPWWLKRYFWLGLVAAGYGVYITWSLYLQAAGTREEFWAGFGRFSLPYLAALSLLGYLVQKAIDHLKHNGSEE